MKNNCICPLYHNGTCHADMNQFFEPTTIDKKRYCFSSRYHHCYILHEQIEIKKESTPAKNRLTAFVDLITTLEGLA